MTDLKDATGPQVGHALSGFGVNLLVRRTRAGVDFLTDVMGFKLIRVDQDFALLKHGNQLFQLHADPTYAEHPLPSLIAENGIRGGGVELRLFDVDPDEAEARAEEQGYTILRESLDRPHGLRECYIMDPDGYCWVPSKRI
ncbi:MULTISPECIES: VOC family protein [Kordiimonas]|jgi:catechol 2,3-dioxygenase-like lactoylglutathione lyase family enzyme|uniref:VOC family protein n=1 Tax=Kordiimonas TaxID=288021 RepID=UPI00257E9C75|nr:VOC family protein [Kordiimonas sp. UBA4487]